MILLSHSVEIGLTHKRERNMKTFKFIETEIFDNTIQDQDGKIQPSEISVGVHLEIDNKKYCLDFQTTTTRDYGAYSARLASYNENSDHEALSEIYGDDFDEFLIAVEEEAKPQQTWQQYVNENYELDENHFNGLDANSNVNSALVLKKLSA